MEAILICPNRREAVPLLSRQTALAAVPLLGQSLVEHWLSHLACAGVRSVAVFASDRAGQIRTLAGDGARWGLTVRVVPCACEPAVGPELLKDSGLNQPPPAPENIRVLDCFPGRTKRPLFSGYADWFAACLDWIPRAQVPDRVGVRQIRRGVWSCLPGRIASGARLTPPCWLGRNVLIGSGAVIGPNAILEDGVLVEAGAEVSNSWVGPETFVGRLARVHHSLVLGDLLLDWRTNSVVKVPDPFLLGAMGALRVPETVEFPLAEPRAGVVGSGGEARGIWRFLLLNRGS